MSVRAQVAVVLVLLFAMVLSASAHALGGDWNWANTRPRVQKRFYNWDAPLEKRFYNWENGKPQLSPKERDFVKQFLSRRGGADWLRSHKMFAQFTDVPLLD